MIKVKDTKTHKTNIIVKHDLPYIALVTDAELVLVECEEVKHAILHNIINKNGKFYKPILISRIEKIEVGELVYLVKDKVITESNHNLEHYEDYEVMRNYCKILALPEHFSPQQLQDIVDGKLKEGKCLVECQLWNSSNSGNTAAILEDGFRANDEYVIKLNPHITIYPVEEKMFTRDEVNQVVIKYLTDYSDLEWKEWFEQNVK